MTPQPTTAERYRRFAAVEAEGVSPLYEQLALGVANDHDLLSLLSDLPPIKRQPNLLFAATRYVAGTATNYSQFRRSVLDNRDAVVATMLSRLTQTNEPARCAAIYPLLAALPQPLALLEVGASAGLCLLPDHYRYDYDGHIAGAVASPLTLHCRVEGQRLGNAGTVRVMWRAGVDLNPLDVTDPSDVQWLKTLVWPEQHDRLRRLEAAIAIAQQDPPRVLRGDLNARLGEVAAQAPSDATLVIFHTAVLSYLSAEDRATFVAQVEQLNCRWISQEAPAFLPNATHVPQPRLPTGPAPFVLALDQSPVAYTAPHGGWLHWLPPADQQTLQGKAKAKDS